MSLSNLDLQPTVFTVLLVEDSRADALLNLKMLQLESKPRFQVTHVCDLTSAIASLNHQVFDAILLDLSLPDSQGLDTLITLKQQANNSPIVVLTGIEDQEMGIEALHRGAQDYLVKSQINREILIRSLRYAIERHRIEQDRKRQSWELKAANQKLEENTKQLEDLNQKLAQEIEERQQAEVELKASVKEKELLLKEIHHRVKNNLLVVSSLLDLQSHYIQDPKIIKIIEDSQHRLYSIALLHEKLYQSQKFSTIDLGEYLKSLVNYLLISSNLSEDIIDIHLELELILVNIETAIPVGLIVNELLFQFCKKAAYEQEKSQIWLELHQDSEQKITLTIQNNGTDWLPKIDCGYPDSLSLELVCILTEQLAGIMELEINQGNTFKLTFTELHYRQRFYGTKF